MTLYVEVAGGIEPLIYRSKRNLYLVPSEFKLARYKFACKAHALQAIKRHPSRYEYGAFIVRALLETPTIQQWHFVERKRLRRWVRALIASASALAAPIEEEGEENHE